MTDHKHDHHRAPIDSEIDVRRTIEVGLWLGGTTIGALIVGYFIYLGLGKWSAADDPAPSPLVEANRSVLPPGPNLQEHPEQELQTMRAEDRARLTSWGWSNRSAGIAHMPIEAAIDRLAVPEPAAAAPLAAAPAAGHAATDGTDGHAAPEHAAPADAHAPESQSH